MALIHVSQKELCALSSIKSNEVEPILTSLGIPLEATEGDDLSLEITPNRPDWLSVEGVARSCHSFKTGKPKTYAAVPSSIHWTIHPSVRPIRPILGSAVARHLRMTESLLTSLIQLQEKLHDTLGRKRRKMAIGIHDLASVHPPFTYKAVGLDDVRFTPLGKSALMTPAQILLEHEKGVDYAHLIESAAPLIVDKNDEVLSMPPIINGERTRLTLGSSDLLIDCTGVSEEAVRTTVNIICAALADRGATIEQVTIDNKPYSLFSPTEWKMSAVAPAASKLLGIPLSAEEAARHLRRLGHEADARAIRSPAYRADLMHEVDLIEDIAISIGLNNLPMPLPDFASSGSLAGDASGLHESMLGLGYFEAMSWILTSQQTLERAQIDVSQALRVNNPLTAEFTTLRPWLYPNLLEIFSRSKSEPLPQYLYEIGPVEQKEGGRGPGQKEGGSSKQSEHPVSTPSGFDPSGHPAPASSVFSQSAHPASASPIFSQSEHLAAAAIHPKSCFSQTLSHLQGLLSARGKSVSLEALETPGFIPGRSARLMHEKQEVGRIGEIHPSVLESFGLEQPVALFELKTDFLKPKA